MADRGLRQGLTSYGDDDFSLYLRKVFIKAAGYSDDALDRPIVGIINTGSDYNPCHGNASQLVEAVKRGVMLSGALPMVFPTISIHESFAHPTSMFLRNLMAMDTEEMILRIKALLRRSKIVSEHQLTIGDVVLDYDALTVTKGENKQTLPQKEFYLLYKLLSYPDRIFTRIQLMDEIWGMESESTDVTVNVHINRLRKRFEDYPEFELVSVRGLGYKAVKKI